VLQHLVPRPEWPHNLPRSGVSRSPARLDDFARELDMHKLDRIDLKILYALQKDGRITNVNLADAVGLSP
jgi:hypothetical protein